jgi:cystathionine beta-lyase
VLLCNPHNPTGRCLTKEELDEILAIAEKHDLLIIADEIHADLVYSPHTHAPIGSLAPHRVVTLNSASKSFNVAGLHYAVSHIGPQWVADALNSLPERVVGEPGMMGVIAAHAAWTVGAPWLHAARTHLATMRALTVQLVEDHLPGVSMVTPEATYLAWLDCSASPITQDPAAAFARAGVAVNPGRDFGTPWQSFVRLNFATSTEMMTTVVHTMAMALR